MKTTKKEEMKWAFDEYWNSIPKERRKSVGVASIAFETAWDMAFDLAYRRGVEHAISGEAVIIDGSLYRRGMGDTI